jgi:hypothetical protein
MCWGAGEGALSRGRRIEGQRLISQETCSGTVSRNLAAFRAGWSALVQSCLFEACHQLTSEILNGVLLGRGDRKRNLVAATALSFNTSPLFSPVASCAAVKYQQCVIQSWPVQCSRHLGGEEPPATLRKGDPYCTVLSLTFVPFLENRAIRGDTFLVRITRISPDSSVRRSVRGPHKYNLRDIL